MAILKQKFVTVRTDAENLDRVLSVLAADGDFFAETPDAAGKNTRFAADAGEQNPYSAMAERIAALSEEINVIGVKPGVKKGASGAAKKNSGTGGDGFINGVADYIEKSSEKLSELTHTCDSIKHALDEDNKILEQLGHLKGVDIPIEELFSFRFFKIRFGYIPAENYERLKMYLGGMKSAIFTPFSEEKDSVWGMYSVIARREDEVDASLAAMGFKRVRISERVTGNPEKAYETFSKELAEIKQGYDDVHAELMTFAGELAEKLPSFSEELSVMSEAFELRRKTVINGETASIGGWVSAKRLADFEKKLTECAGGVTVTSNDPGDTNLTPPTKLKNLAIFRPFESFVTMYGAPAYNETDPTVMFALTYSIFFGLMFGDVGQGAVIMLVGLFLYFVKHVNLGGIFAFVGAFAMGGGFLYGSVFGNEELIHGLFVPSENINGTLLAAVSIGVVMIIVCGIVNIINGIRQKKVDKYLLSPNGLVGIAFYVSALVAALGMFGMIESSIVPIGVLTAVIVVCAVLLFVREPLSKLLEKRRDWLPSNIGESVAENFFELFEVVLSYVTNTISFIRIGAFALSHAGMMTVVYLLASTPTGYNPVILVIGNLVVIGVEGLIVGIQVLRLEFYELFSRFYSGDGRSAKQ